MAEITTHIFMAKDIQKILNCNDAIKCFSVGPDPFYFSKKTRPLASLMHKNNSFIFFKNYIEYIKLNHLENNQYIIASLYGFLSHYLLDSMVHPYVFYFDHLDRDEHRRIEMSLSKYIISSHNIKPNKYKMFKEFNNVNNEELIKLLDYVFLKTFGYKDYGHEYIKCINKMKRIYKLFRYDRFGIKKFIYKIIDTLSNKKLRYVSFYNIEEADLNINHNEWIHPCVEGEIHKESLIDLYNESINKLIEIINNLDFNKPENELNKIIGNRSYLTGKDCNIRYQMTNFYYKN